MTAPKTESVPSEPVHSLYDNWTLVLAMDCQALGAAPLALHLVGVDEVVVERGPERRVAIQGAWARVACPDRWMSQTHARLIRKDDGWLIEDGDSRNGTKVNGTNVYRRPLDDGDLIECGGTFFVIRRGASECEEPHEGRPDALRTLCPSLERELRMLRKVAVASIPVLILGDTGTGKEGTAAAIHDLSRRDGPFLAVNCGAIPSTLIASELFGTKRGAFSGAQNRDGLFLRADRGTLFLDEVAELPESSQAALLRVLQEDEIIPLGCDRSISVDVRVIAATNRPLAQFISKGTFRHDLYARLSCYELALPPLRKRREDLGFLIATLLNRHDTPGSARTLTRDAARSLFAYDWPLNIRELEHCILAALTLAGHEIGIEHLRPSIRAGLIPAAASTLERDTILATIRLHRGNMSAVARALAMSRSYLYQMLDRYEIRRIDF